MSQPVAPKKLRVRGMILTGGVAAITIVGTRRSNITQKKEVIQDAHYEVDMISTLETRRAGLMQARQQWERKAKALQERIDGNKLRTIPGIGGTNGATDGSASSGK
ncbi:hypothetical protein F503_03662 [Ophiostoma piceae UAMH 11346]|uniref:Uncharacterized protein n=1 Tax=Ophiostoma piceae (strain UAMH 11346) TaxID=1262450 RepID=S3CV27_OPHP1|nr:hypothetical protein F503_03662 [Ophiostoma piceae UAMH 11346]